MNRFRTFSRMQVLAIAALLVALVAVACGSDDSSVVSSGGGGDDENPKVIRMIESTKIFTADDMKAIGWKSQRDFVLEYPGTTAAEWGFLNTKEVGVLIYASADDAKTLGVTAADAQTYRRPEDGHASDEGVDRISCRHAQGQSAVKANTGIPSKSFSASYLDPEIGEVDDIAGVTCPNRFPTYNDYVVIGNMVVMCEGDGRNLLEPSTNCKDLEKWLTK
ncbi:MAG: hypothetical protein QF357_05085 [Dehalococcoidia bacterium]|nr:hypothetical protein [Dehalococcoidia bacterium]